MGQLTLEQGIEAYMKKREIHPIHASNVIKDFTAGAEWQKEQAKWISVKDKLPGLLLYILVYNTEGATLIARRFENGWWALFADGEHFMGELAATHWQPLPEPPQD